MRKALLKVHQKKIGAYIFDGTVMYTSRRLSDVSSKGIDNTVFISHKCRLCIFQVLKYNLKKYF